MECFINPDPRPAPPPMRFERWGTRERSDGQFTLLIDSDPELSFIDRKSCSPSTANSFAGCPARAAVDRLTPKDYNPFDPAPMGNLIHDGLEDFYGLEPGQRTPQRLQALLEQQAERVCRDPLPRGSLAEQMWEATHRLWEIENPAEVEAVHRELHIDNVEVAGVPINGYVDRVRRLSGGSLHIDDYKTGKLKPPKYRTDYLHQQRIYVMAMRELGHSIGGATLLYTAAGKAVPVGVGRDVLAATARHLTGSWRRLKESVESGEFPMVTSPLCGWCPLVEACPAAQRAGLCDRAGVAIEGLVLESRPLCKAKTTNAATREEPMIDTKPYVEEVAGSRNAGSYAAMAAFSISTMATKLMSEAGVELVPSQMRAFALLLGKMCADVAESLSGSRSLQGGAHTRARGVVYAMMELTPPPFGADQSGWKAWVEQVTARSQKITQIAVAVWDDEGSSEPQWAKLAQCAATNTEKAA